MMMWKKAVVPGYYLVCYNNDGIYDELMKAVVPGYYLVCYNPFPFRREAGRSCSSRLLLGML